MRDRLIFAVLLINSGLIWAQKQNTEIIRSDIVIANYLTGVETYAALYTGKMETPYDIPFSNHPYFETTGYISGTLCYNRVVYKDVLMRLDLYRDELSVMYPDMKVGIVLNNDKFDYAVLNEAVIIKTAADRKTKEKYVVLLHNGTYPVVKVHDIRIIEELSSLVVRRYFRIQYQYAIYSDGILYPVKNKSSILKMFPDSRKELNEYAKRHKLDFIKYPEQSIVSLVDHYEDIMSQKHADEADETDLRR